MFNDIASLLPKTIKKAGLAKQMAAVNVMAEYERIAKELLPAKACEKLKPLYLKDGILTVASLSSVLAQELVFKNDEIISQLNKLAGSSIVQKIKYLT